MDIQVNDMERTVSLNPLSVLDVPTPAVTQDLEEGCKLPKRVNTRDMSVCHIPIAAVAALGSFKVRPLGSFWLGIC